MYPMYPMYPHDPARLNLTYFFQLHSPHSQPPLNNQHPPNLHYPTLLPLLQAILPKFDCFHITPWDFFFSQHTHSSLVWLKINLYSTSLLKYTNDYISIHIRHHIYNVTKSAITISRHPQYWCCPLCLHPQIKVERPHPQPHTYT